jgi:hypothetical protein
MSQLIDKVCAHPLRYVILERPLTAATDRLSETGVFKVMTTSIDEDEHSFEMHMPFLYKMSAP